jgi:hypothetical protein
MAAANCHNAHFDKSARRSKSPRTVYRPFQFHERSQLSSALIDADFPAVHLELCEHHCLLFETTPNDSEQHAGNNSSRSQEGFVEIKLAYYRQLCRSGRVFAL